MTHYAQLLGKKKKHPSLLGEMMCHYADTTLCLKKGYHPTTNDNFNNSCPILVIFGTNIAE